MISYIKVLKVILILIILVPSNHMKAYSIKRNCEIKYGEKRTPKNLEQDFLDSNNSYRIKSRYSYECYQIGVEHTKDKVPINNKPIYSCCFNI